MKRIPDIIIEPKKQTHKGNIIPILITKNKHKMKINTESMIKENPIYNLHTKKQYI